MNNTQIIHRQEHEEEIKEIMKQTNFSFKTWRGKEFWTLANECGHTSLDFNKCQCKNYKKK